MTREQPMPELLAPAGGEQAFYAALAGGADAIYLGGRSFNARAYADNFDTETLSRCLAIAHARGVKVYVTVNTLLTDRELPEAVSYAEELYRMGVDALIVADVGLISLLRQRLPAFPIHASTQLSLHSSRGVKELSDLAPSVAVPARELPRRDVRSMVKNSGVGVEVFLHGALCVCHSGQCLFSSLVGGRSGNRGTCAQPCRLPYNHGYPLSLKDLSMADHVTDLIDDGVCSLKIEGRMKSPAYVWGVTRIYRRLLDEKRNATPAEREELSRIFSRGGFTDGYYTDTHQKPMTGVRSESDKAHTRALETIDTTPDKVPLTACCEILRGEPARLTLTDPMGRTVTVTGDTPADAISAPLKAAAVAARLTKMGNTPFVLSQENVGVVLDEGLNLSPASLNDLRRRAVACLTQPRRDPVPEAPVSLPAPAFSGEGHSALFCDPAVWDGLSQEERDFFSLAFVPLWLLDGCKHLPRGIWMPPVIFDSEEEAVRNMLLRAKEKGITHALCGNPAQISLAREYGFEILGDFRLNITNRSSADYWHRHGVSDAVLSPELTAPQLRDVGGRTFVYGRIPLMLTERCFMREIDNCDNCGKVALTDRRGVTFPLMRVYPHRNQILNSLPTYLGDIRHTLPRTVRAHFLFTVEGVREVREVISAYREGKPLPYAVRRLPKDKM